MRIAHLATSISINQVLLGRMIRQRELGHDVTALCPDDEWAVGIREKGFRVIDVPWVRHDVWATPRAALRTWEVCRRERFDIVHTTNALPGLIGRPAARLAGMRVVHTVRAWPLNEPRTFAQRLGLKMMEPVAARACAAIMFQNPDDMKSWTDLWGVPPGRATLVGNGLDVAAFDRRIDPSARVRIRHEFGIPEDAFVISVVARFEPAKRHDHLFRGLRNLLDRPGPPVVALLAGTGSLEARFRAEVDRLELADAVRFTGYRDDIPDLLVASDAGVLTSLYEGIPRGLMESMTVGLPIVATSVPGTRSLVVDDRTGFLVSVDDVEQLAKKLQLLRIDPELAAVLGRAGRKRIEAWFDERQVTDRVLTVYEHVRAGKPGPLPAWDLDAIEEVALEVV
jgi:glycosyltransferase involved in cell wall biosynthesis